MSNSGRRNNRRLAARGLWLLAAGWPVAAQSPCEHRSLTGELFTGSAWSVPLPLTVSAPGGPLRIVARYSTRPFEDAPYYSYRIGRQDASGASPELELLHHKLYLENPHPPVERMEISHGYNLAVANVAGPGHRWQWRFGVGIVVAHPEGRVAGHELSGAPTALGGSYHVAGITTQLAVGRRYAWRPGRTQLLATPEAKVTASWARISVDSITLTVPNVALHALGGLGVRHCY
jgi:hypothetical protein